MCTYLKQLNYTVIIVYNILYLSLKNNLSFYRYMYVCIIFIFFAQQRELYLCDDILDIYLKSI